MPGVLPSTYTNRLFQIQSAQEVTWGTPIAIATSRWMAVKPYPQFKLLAKSTLFDEDRGNLANAFNSAVLVNGMEFTVDWEYATYEDINFPLYNLLQAIAPTGGNPYTYTYASPLTAVNALTPFTLEYAYDIATVQYAGCLGQKMTIKGEMEKQWECSYSGFAKSFNIYAAVNIVSSTNATPIVITTAGDPFVTGNQVVVIGHLVNTNANGTWTIIRTGAGTYSLTGSVGNGVGAATGTITQAQTPAIADRVVEPIIFPGTQLFIDTAAGTIGTTVFANSFLGFQLDLENGVLPIYGADSKTPIAYSYDKFKATLTLKLLFNAQVKALLNSTLVAGTGVLTRIKQTSGTKQAQFDFAGVLADDPQEWGQEKGAAMIEFKLESRLDTGAFANQFKSVIINAVSALP